MSSKVNAGTARLIFFDIRFRPHRFFETSDYKKEYVMVYRNINRVVVLSLLVVYRLPIHKPCDSAEKEAAQASPIVGVDAREEHHAIKDDVQGKLGGEFESPFL